MQEKYIAFIDILGFKELVSKNSHDKLEEIYDILERGIKNIDILYPFKNINSMLISDSFILWSEDLSVESFFNLLIIVRDELWNGFYNGIPVRAAIDIGNVSLRQTNHKSTPFMITNTIFGKGLVNAYSLCESQAWAGGVISNEAIKSFTESINFRQKISIDVNEIMALNIVKIPMLEKRYFIKYYNVPFKNKEEIIYIRYATINWVNAIAPKFPKEILDCSFTKFKKTVNEKVEKYIVNTEKYWESCNDRTL